MGRKRTGVTATDWSPWAVPVQTHPGPFILGWSSPALSLCPRPAAEVPRFLKWPMGGTGGNRRVGEGRNQGLSPPVAVPWAASEGGSVPSAAGPPWVQLPPGGPGKPHLLPLCPQPRGEVASCHCNLWVTASTSWLLSSSVTWVVCSWISCAQFKHCFPG